MGGTGNIVNPKTVYSSQKQNSIYVFEFLTGKFKGCLKVGQKEYPIPVGGSPSDKQKAREIAVRQRISEYTKTFGNREGIDYKILYSVDANYANGSGSFTDHAVHRALIKNGIKRENAEANPHSEIFNTDLATVQEAINSVAFNRILSLTPSTNSKGIVLREEQQTAVTKTLREFKGATFEHKKKVLWNAKMRFGKTITAYSMVKDNSDTFRNVLIVSHKPNDVGSGWEQDFVKVGLDKAGYRFETKDQNYYEDNQKRVVFVSIQDLRGRDGETLDYKEKNKELFDTEWDLVITDEAHNGSTTSLAINMFKELKTPRFLDLSGTPFNLMNSSLWEDQEATDRFTYDYIYSWSYNDERIAYETWDSKHPGEPNPYETLPEVKFITFSLGDILNSLDPNEEYSPNLSDLFKTKRENGVVKFTHEKQVKSFLKSLTGENAADETLFPYNDEWSRAGQFKHTLWMLPSVEACVAMKDLLGLHSSSFSGYTVINATGVGKGDLQAVLTAVKEDKPSITLSYQMLTTGVSVPEWSAVFMMNNTSNPMNYMQSAFRCATPWVENGEILKSTAYVFDFNPERCLSQVAAVIKHGSSSKSSGNSNSSLEDNRISIMSLAGGEMVELNTKEIMDKINELTVNEIVSKGFDSPYLWNATQLENFDIKRRDILNAINRLQGKSSKKTPSVHLGTLAPEEKAELEALRKKKREEKLSPEEGQKKGELERREKEERKNRDNAIKILSSVAIRVPLLVFAVPNTQEITTENFNKLIDDESWGEFMPKGLKRLRPEGVKSLEEDPERLEGENSSLYWEDITIFFNEDNFARACNRLRGLVEEADSKQPLERALRLMAIFGSFRNPDKETVLTPSRVAEMQYLSALGGLQVLDLDNSTAKVTQVLLREKATGKLVSSPLQTFTQLLEEGTHELAPLWQDNDFWHQDHSTYDINSKSAMYPLQGALSRWWYLLEENELYRKFTEETLKQDFEQSLWQRAVKSSVFLNCRVPFSKRIAQRVMGDVPDFEENVTVLDVVELKNILKQWNELRVRNQPEGWVRLDIHKALGVILRVTNKGLMGDSYRGDIKELVDRITDVEQEENLMENLKKLVAEISGFEELKTGSTDGDSESSPLPKFDAVVGNPPYQIETGGRNHQVYPDFYLASRFSSNFCSLIFPIGWQDSSGAGSGSSKHTTIRSDTGIVSVDNYYEAKDSPIILFPGAGTGGVNIVFADTRKNKPGVRYLEYGVLQEKNKDLTYVSYWSEKTDEIFQKIQNWTESLGIPSARGLVSGRNPFNIGSATVSELSPDYHFVSFSEIPNGIKFFANPKNESRPKFFWLPRNVKWAAGSAPDLSREMLWKCFWPKAGSTFSWRRTIILKPGEIASESFLGVFFNTLEEAKGFESFLRTLFVRFCNTESATDHNAYRKVWAFVPDLTSVTNPRTGKVGWNSDWTDSDLKELLKDALTEEDWAYIEETARASDPKGEKMLAEGRLKFK